MPKAGLIAVLERGQKMLTTIDYSQHDSASKKRRLIIDRHELSLHLEMDDAETGDQVIAEFDLAEAEEIAAALDRVCRNIRMKRS
jgi:hypothetical protein